VAVVVVDRPKTDKTAELVVTEQVTEVLEELTLF
jgi:hypothetical protein